MGTPISEDTSESKTDSLDAADINAIEVWYKECLILSVCSDVMIFNPLNNEKCVKFSV